MTDVITFENKLKEAIKWMTSKTKISHKPTIYPANISNIDKVSKFVHNIDEHIEHIFNTNNHLKLSTRLNVAKLNITDVISSHDETWDIINTYFAAEKWGISFIYKSMEDIPNRVWHGIQIIKNELARIENEEANKS